MDERQAAYLTPDTVAEFADALLLEEKSRNTISKYRHDLNGFAAWLGGRGLTREAMIDYKHHLQGLGMAPSSINSVLSAMNKLAMFLGRPDLKMKFLKIQGRVFRENARDLTKEDYVRLVDTAYSIGKPRLGLILETIGSTGIRISELRYVTVEALETMQFTIDLKSKLRTVMLPKRLCRKLRKYCDAHGITRGQVFRTRTGRPLSRQQVWREMKQLCDRAGIPDSKVYPHNFRHMFATVFYASCKDIVKLADVLGHSSIDTTRIYLISSGREHARQLEKLGLVR